MLKIQEFIFAHPTDWEELLSAAPYNLKISRDEDYVLFKYNQISSDFNEPICREARGIILDEQDNFRVVRMAFKKFFNLDEGFADEIDWATAIATEKIDGSIVSMWYGRGGWRVSTNGTIDAYKAELSEIAPYKTFGDLFSEAARRCNLNIGYLNPDYCYTFELVSPYNKVVLSYPEPAIYLLSVRDMVTLEEKTGFCDLGEGVLHPKEYNLNTEAEYRQCVEDMPDGHEGIVIRDAAGHRVKLKTLLYFELHHTNNNGALTMERVVDLIRANDYAEYLAYFPERKEIFDKVKTQMSSVDDRLRLIKRYVAYWRANNPNKDRGEFAAFVRTLDHSSFYFAAYDGRLDQTIERMTTKKYVEIFKIGEDW